MPLKLPSTHSKLLLIFLLGAFPLRGLAAKLDCAQNLTSGISPPLEQALTRAATLEKSLLEDISSPSRNTPTAPAALMELQTLIDELLTSPRAFRITQISERISWLSSHLSICHLESAMTVTPKRSLRFARRAKKDLETIPQYLADKFAEFYAEIGTCELNELSPKWTLEKINMAEITRNLTYSVRLNRGYRVVFSLTDNEMIVYGISMKLTHDN